MLLREATELRVLASAEASEEPPETEEEPGGLEELVLASAERVSAPERASGEFQAPQPQRRRTRGRRRRSR